jgi:UDP-N-acetylglucosamine 2-epimerase
MQKLKVMTILGTRPEIIRLSACIKACDKYFDHILVHTGQNWDYTLNQVFFDDLELRVPNYYLDSVGQTLGETMGNIIAKSYAVLQKEMPDAVLILGDTNSALSAISAKRLKIPIFHMEAGNRCHDGSTSLNVQNRLVV